MLGHRTFVYAGDPVPKLQGTEYDACLINIWRGLLLSLEERGLLTPKQRERCLRELEKKKEKRQSRMRPPSPGIGGEKGGGQDEPI
ncbi:MAG: hypothetical protein HFI63_04290 [Lachnospiraceae bacterium]|nr:hypothetical protein [Lachnospiraceae bacterium]